MVGYLGRIYRRKTISSSLYTVTILDTPGTEERLRNSTQTGLFLD